MSHFTNHAFLSFRAKEIGKTFGDHLYAALINAGIRTVKPDDQPPEGETEFNQQHQHALVPLKRLPSKQGKGGLDFTQPYLLDNKEAGETEFNDVQKAIIASRVLIVVFSKDYASSERCLDQLVFIFETRKVNGNGLIPVFYDVDPSEVRKQKGCFEEAFGRYERRVEMQEKVKQWKDALKQVADLGGMVLQNQSDGFESKFIQEIARAVGRKLNRKMLNVASHPTGLNP